MAEAPQQPQLLPSAGGSHEPWMRLALEEAARAAAAGEVPVGAVLVRDGTLLGAGHNRPITSHDPTAHAEVAALRSAAENVGNYRLPGTILYVTIEPCTMCVGALMHARVAHVVYGAPEPRAGALVSAAQLSQAGYFNHRLTFEGGVLEAECAAALTRFFRARRKGD